MANLKDMLPTSPLAFSRVVPLNPVRVGILVESTLQVGPKITALEGGTFGVIARLTGGSRVLVPWANVASADLV